MNESGGVALSNEAKRVYEAMFLVDSDAAGADWDAMISTISNIMDRADAEVINLRKWDDRRLCYEINRHKRGTYVLSYFRALPSSISRIERDVQLNESIFRVLILRADYLSKDAERAEAQMDTATPVMRAEEQVRAAEAARSEKAAAAQESAEPVAESIQAQESTNSADQQVVSVADSSDRQDAGQEATETSDVGQDKAVSDVSGSPAESTGSVATAEENDQVDEQPDDANADDAGKTQD